ncbi:YcbK family protein [Pusillimonas minor]|uniref:Murein endopeptidase K n=1 Tax=Pusillimonas minor TaxID=2697024 RepID=A0A842HLU4_9BURK|nr:DUF882 domain-containing protein [Pusillimonas minor]MBC2768310.1 DUF882 domain-containing protein [Pusillimonas minor]
MSTPPHPARRSFLRRAASITLAAGLPVLSAPALAGIRIYPRHVAFNHTHRDDRLSLVYAHGDRYLPPALDRLNVFLRDHYTQAIGTMDPLLYDQLDRIRKLLNTDIPYDVISAYRDPQTNERLRTTRGGGVAKRSLHMDGKAIDIRLPGIPLAEVRDAALSLNAGGVGFYPRDQFVHIDTGRVRSW